MDILKDYWENLDRTSIGKRVGAELADFLTEKLSENECDHTHKYTNQFFSNKNIFFRIIGCLWTQRFYCCDCEVELNLYWRKDLGVRSVRFKKNRNGILSYSDGTQYDHENYSCGLKAGDLLLWKESRIVKDDNGIVVKEIKAGEIFQTLKRNISFPKPVWLLSRDHPGMIYREDSTNIFEEFVKVEFTEDIAFIYALYPIYQIDEKEILSNEFIEKKDLHYPRSIDYDSALMLSKSIDKVTNNKEFQYKELIPNIQFSDDIIRKYLIQINSRINKEIIDLYNNSLAADARTSRG